MRFGTRRRLIAVLILASVTLMTLDQRPGTHGFFNSLRSTANESVSPLTSASHTVLGPVHDYLTGLSNAGSLQRDNVKLRNQVAELKSELQGIADARDSAAKIREAAGLKSVAQLPDSFANVISPTRSNFEQTVVVDRGSNDGIKIGNPVVAGDGLVGRVIEVMSTQSVVRLISDPNQSVGVRLVKAKEIGVAQGTGPDRQLKLRFIASGAKFSKNEVVVTAGLTSSLFPPGIPVGRVVSTSRSLADPEVAVTLEAVVNLDELDVVRILKWTPVSEEAPSPTTTTTTSAVPDNQGSSSSAKGSNG